MRDAQNHLHQACGGPAGFERSWFSVAMPCCAKSTKIISWSRYVREGSSITTKAWTMGRGSKSLTGMPLCVGGRKDLTKKTPWRRKCVSCQRDSALTPIVERERVDNHGKTLETKTMCLFCRRSKTASMQFHAWEEKNQSETATQFQYVTWGKSLGLMRPLIWSKEQTI